MSDLGRVSYHVAQERQSAIVAGKRHFRNLPDKLLLMELDPVVTLGRGGGPEQVLLARGRLRSRGIDFVETDRGGGATYHGPGQLTAYPILDLSFRRDLRDYLRKLEEVALGVLTDFGVGAHAVNGLTGVWVGDRKIAAIGIRAQGWVTSHGVAINLDPDLSNYLAINQCGLTGKGATSMAMELGSAPSRRMVADRFIDHFCRVFGYGDES